MKAAPDNQVPKHRSHKPTVHWCRGKVGVEHLWQWCEDRKRHFRVLPEGTVLSKYACAACGKDARQKTGITSVFTLKTGRVAFYGPAFGDPEQLGLWYATRRNL